MAPASSAQNLYDRVIAGRGSEEDHHTLAEWLGDTGRLLQAFHVVNLAAERFGGGASFEGALAAAFQRLEVSGGVEDLVRSLPGPLAEAFAEELADARRNHGPEAIRPATREFVLCVALKNLLPRFHRLFPGALALLRICDCYGRVAAEQSWGRKAGNVLVRDGVARVTVGGRELVYAVSPDDLRSWLNYFILEPGLLRWVATFDARDVFLDIGANVGRFSILAAGAAGCRTVAVEPFSVNFAALENNVALNSLQDDVVTIRAAIHDVTGSGRLSFAERVAGAAGQHFWGAEKGGEDEGAEHLDGYRLDDLVASGRIDFPNHIKIDVDGGEHRLIDGMSETLKDDRLRSIRLEIRLDEAGNPAALDRIRQAGFDCAVDDDSKNYLCRRV